MAWARVFNYYFDLAQLVILFVYLTGLFIAVNFPESTIAGWYAPVIQLREETAQYVTELVSSYWHP